MASNYNSKVQIEKMKQLTAAYNELKKDLDLRLEMIVADLDNSGHREFWYNRWKNIHNLMEADYFKRMDKITKGEI